MRSSQNTFFSLFCGLLGICLGLNAQEGVYNHGSMYLHAEGSLGIHEDFSNDGPFDADQSLVGFYKETGNLQIQGTYSPVFYDAEFDTALGLQLFTPISVLNNGNIISGDIQTDRATIDFHIQFLQDAFYVGESSVSKVDGFASFQNKENFLFPVGDEERIRPLRIQAQDLTPFMRCAYFFENPESSKYWSYSYPTRRTASTYLKVSSYEFWKLEGSTPVQASLSWDVYSNIGGLAPLLSDLRVVGWHKQSQEWVSLGNTAVEGGRDYGWIRSEYFVPDEYEIITLGADDEALSNYTTIELDNYYMSPNADGNNDVLEIAGIETLAHNDLQIYNRYGILVYQKKNYQNEFEGFSNRDLVVQQQKKLEPGIYFYILTFPEIQEKHQGYLYLTN